MTRVEFLLLEAPATSSVKLFVSFGKALKGAQVLESIFLDSFLPGGHKNTRASGYLKLTASLYLTLLLH